MFWNEFVEKIAEKCPKSYGSIRWIVQDNKIGKKVPGQSRISRYSDSDVATVVDILNKRQEADKI